jgi:hypothetical protein
VDFTVKFNDWITGAGKTPDPIMVSLNLVHHKLNEIQDFNLASWVTSREDSLAFLLAHSAAALATAHAFVQSEASRTDPVWAAKIAFAERDSLLAVQTFTADLNRGYWMRPQSLKALSWAGDPTDYYRGWMPHLPDRAEVNPFGQVWDHRWALPALVYTIAVRVAVLGIFANGTRAERRAHCSEIQTYVKVLQEVQNKMWSGICALYRLSDLQREQYLHTGRIPLAVADIYGGYYLGGIYFSSDFRPGRFPLGLEAPQMIIAPGTLAQVEFNMAEFANHWWSIVSRRIGLADLLVFTFQLRNMCEATWFTSRFVEIHSELRRTKRDPKVRKSTIAAIGLSNLAQTDEDDEGARAARTHVLYEALRTGGSRAQRIVATCVRNLSQLTEQQTNAYAPAQPARARSAAAKRRKGKKS